MYQQMKDARYEVKSYVRKCRAKAERKLIQERDDMFKTKDEREFSEEIDQWNAKNASIITSYISSDFSAFVVLKVLHLPFLYPGNSPFVS